MYMLKKRRKRALIWIVKLNTLLGYHTRYLHCCWRSERGQTRRVCPWHAQERRPCRGLRRVDCPFQAGPGIRAKARGNRRGRHEQSGADPRMKLLTVYNNLLRPPASWKKKTFSVCYKKIIHTFHLELIHINHTFHLELIFTKYKCNPSYKTCKHFRKVSITSS